MQDRELCQRIAESIAPWTVGEIKVESSAQQLEVQVECNDAVPKRCPHCVGTLLVCNHGEEQTWRQLDAGPWQILLKGRLPLVECPEHGIVLVSPPWADWYIRGQDQSLLGPWSLQQIKLLLDVGRISPSTLLKRSSSNKWVITGTVSALFVTRDETVEPPLSVDELAAVDWAIANEPTISLANDPTASNRIPTGDNASVDGPGTQSEADRNGDSQKEPRRKLPTRQPPAGQDANPEQLEFDADLGVLDDSDRTAIHDSLPILKRLRAPTSRKSKRPPAAREESSQSEWTTALGQAAEMEQTAKVGRKKSVNDTATQRIKAPQRVKAASRHQALVRRRGFQQGYQLLMVAYLINACLVCCLVPTVCTIFFSRLLLLSTSVFAPFEGGNELHEGQLVACGLSALCVLVLIGFPIWHLISNGGILWHYVPSALIGMTVGFGLSPGYLDEVCAALKWCEFGFGIATVGLTVYTLLAVPAQSRMSLPMIAAGLLTALSVMVLCVVRSGSMLSVQTDVIPPQFRGAFPDAPLYVLGLYGTLVFIPGTILFELYRHTDISSRQFIIRTGVLLGAYLLAGFATLGTFVHGAGAGFFDVPLALLPLACTNALAAAIPSSLSLLDPQYSVSQD